MNRTQRILVVDDVSTNIVLLEEMLSTDYRVESASTGEEALDLLPSFRPDLILLDVMMPGLDGYEVCRRVRADPRYEDTRIIMVSAKAMSSERVHGYEAGADDYVTKPFDEEELLSKIRMYLAVRSAEVLGRLRTGLTSLLTSDTGSPLRGVREALDVLAGDDDPPAAVRERLAALVVRNVERLREFFEQVVDLHAVLETGVEIDEEPIAAAKWIENACRSASERATRRGVAIEATGGTSAVFSGDRRRVGEALRAVLDSAVRFTPEGGRVTVETRSDDRVAIVSVKDEGPGVPRESARRLFEPFADVADLLGASGPSSTGLSIALAMAKAVLEDHDGWIEVETDVGEGVRFEIGVPVLHPQA